MLQGIDESLDEDQKYKPTRGIMIHVNNETEWERCIDCFSSYPRVVGDGDESNGRQIWFTPNHTHDTGAVRSSPLYILPFAASLLGNNENALVNNHTATADERGINAIIVDPENYTSSETTEFKVIQ